MYVSLGKRSFRLRFAHAASTGVAVAGGLDGAEEARQLARHALQRHHAELAPLFGKSGSGTNLSPVPASS